MVQRGKLAGAVGPSLRSSNAMEASIREAARRKGAWWPEAQVQLLSPGLGAKCGNDNGNNLQIPFKMNTNNLLVPFKMKTHNSLPVVFFLGLFVGRSA